MLEPARATFVKAPVAGAVTVTVKFVAMPAASMPRFHVTTPLLLMPLPDALTNVTEAGNESVAMTPLAAEGPELVTIIV